MKDNYTLAYQILEVVDNSVGNNWKEGIGSTNSALRCAIADQIAYLLDQRETMENVTNEAIKFDG